MKNNNFYSILILLSFVVSFSWAQTTETFESYTTGKPTTFISNSQSFTLTSNNCAGNAGGMFGIFIPGQSYTNCDGVSPTSTGTGYGVGISCASAAPCGGVSNKFIDNGSSTGVNQIYSIKTTNSALFTIKSIYVFVSTDKGVSSSTTAGVTFRGKKAGSVVFTLNPTLTANTNGFTFIDFVAAGHGSINIDQLEIQGGNTVNYLALDNFRWGGPVTLPIELISFTVKPISAGVEIDWQTKMENNSSHFELLHSTNGYNFKRLTTIEALGDSKTGKAYSFTHKNPLYGNNFYQLLQYDKNGDKVDYGVKAVEFKGLVDDQILLYPNPTVNSATVKFAASTYVKIEVLDVLGKVVISQKIGAKETERKMDIAGLPSGTYTLLLSDKNNKSVHKLIKL